MKLKSIHINKAKIITFVEKTNYDLEGKNQLN